MSLLVDEFADVVVVGNSEFGTVLYLTAVGVVHGVGFLLPVRGAGGAGVRIEAGGDYRVEEGAGKQVATLIGADVLVVTCPFVFRGNGGQRACILNGCSAWDDDVDTRLLLHLVRCLTDAAPHIFLGTIAFQVFVLRRIGPSLIERKRGARGDGGQLVGLQYFREIGLV